MLAAMGWSPINEGESDKNAMEIELDSARLESLTQKVFYPLTFPITAGPLCIVAMVTLSAHVSTKGMGVLSAALRCVWTVRIKVQRVLCPPDPVADLPFELQCFVGRHF